MTAVVGLDIGTTSAKAAAFDAGGTMHGRAEAGYELAEPQPGWAELDPQAVVDAALRALDRAPDAAGIALSAAMHSLVGLGDDGRPVTGILTWADTRALEQAERLKREHPELHDRTGTPIHPMSPLTKLVWMREHGVRARRWVGVKDLVLHALTGEWATDRSSASGTGLLDIRAGEWDTEGLALAGIDAEQLPRLVDATERVGDVVVGAGDGPLANLGLGAVLPGVAACSIGTSGALRLIVEDPATTERTFCYGLTPGRWAVGGAITNGGLVLEWLTRLFGTDAETLLAEAARVPAGAAGLRMDPYLFPERAPHWDARAEGGLQSLQHRHTRGHVVRAALEGVCRQLALVLESLRDAGYAVREIRASGGFARSALWKQILADQLRMPVGFTASREGSAFGAALLGMAALGAIDSIDHAARLVTVTETYRPDCS